jgi:hypothetical protein
MGGATMKTFIRVVEVWVPDAGCTLLEFGSGWYGDTRGFGAASREMCFGRGEGLPGQAWDQRRPIVLQQLEGSVFRRGRAAAADGLTSAIALPVFVGDRLNAVVLILCGDDDTHVGAIELWRNAAGSPDLVLADGYYGGTADVFEFLSRNTRFRPGTGLPGMAWEAGAPVLMADLGKGSKFLRADSAQQVGINRGFAMPCSVPGADVYVMAFLSALATPLVRRLEVWRPGAEGRGLQRSEGFCESEGTLGAAAGVVPFGEGALGQAWTDAMPVVAQPASAQAGPVGFAARGADLRALLALPVLNADRVVAVLAWYF